MKSGTAKTAMMERLSLSFKTALQKSEGVNTKATSIFMCSVWSTYCVARVCVDCMYKYVYYKYVISLA